jgi:monoamine oxidase
METEVIIVGAGAAGLAAARRLCDARIDCRLIEARPRLGGRAWTVVRGGLVLDLGAGWLHAAKRNAWTEIAREQGREIDTTPPPWERLSLEDRFPPQAQREFLKAQHDYDERLEAGAAHGPDRPASAFLEPGGRWNPLIDAVSTYYSGAELDRLSAADLARYREDNANWRIVGGLGATIAAYGSGLPVTLDCTVRRIDHGGRSISVETDKGTIRAARVIVTLPTALLADAALFAPALPEKAGAAAGLPLGLADKLFMALDGAGEFQPNSRLFGAIDRVATGSYHLRPFGTPTIEAYFGGELAWQLEKEGEAAFFDFARSQLVEVFGSAFARRIALLQVHRWGADPMSRGSYSYARPGQADARAALAAPVDGRLFFAGEACSTLDFSTVHGAFATGIAAADALIATLRS